MKPSEDRYGNTVVLGFDGRIDHTNATGFDAALEPYLEDCRDGGFVIVLDLALLDYMSSAGLCVLMSAFKRVKPVGGAILLCALQPVMREIFEISRFHRIFEIHDTIEDALGGCSDQALNAYRDTAG